MKVEERLKEIAKSPYKDSCIGEYAEFYIEDLLVLFDEHAKSYARELVEEFKNPYPEDVWLPIDQETYHKIHEMLMEKFGMPIDRLAGHIGRKLLEGLKKAMLRRIEEV